MFSLIELPFAPDALAPVISAETIGYHHGKHLQGYVDNLNKLLPGSGLEALSLEEVVGKALSLPAPAGNLIFNNAGQILNHNLYFTQFRPASPGDLSVFPSVAKESRLLQQIEKQWGTIDVFKAEFEQKGVSIFGSGWVWLQADAAGELSIAQYAGADNPIAHGFKPLLTFDVWEHAYYLDYQNRRAAHLKELWGIVDWAVIEKRFDQ